MKIRHVLGFLATSSLLVRCGSSSAPADSETGNEESGKGGSTSSSPSGSHSGGAAGKSNGGAGASGRSESAGSAQGGTNGSAGLGEAGKGSGAGGNGGRGAAGTAGKGAGGSIPAGAGGGTAKIDGGTANGGSSGVGGKMVADASAGGDSDSTGPGGSTGAGGSTAVGDGKWVCTWTGAPQLTETDNNPPSPGLSNNTLRQMVHSSLGGKQIRVRLSNEFGNGSVAIKEAHVAAAKSPSDIDPSTDATLLFSGNKNVTIDQSKAVTSDPLDFDVAALSDVSITIAFGTVPSGVTGHPGSRTTSYIKSGSTVTDASMSSGGASADHWYIISAMEVLGDASARAVVVLGDSISDGRGSTTNKNNRWPDDLAKRLHDNAATADVAVCNQGIGGNTVLSGGLGPTAKDRFDRDVLGAAGVEYLILFEGVNDIGSSNANASSLTSQFGNFVSKAHAKNIKVFGATITPFNGNSYYSTSHESVRQDVNTWLRDPKNVDATLDFDDAVRDPSDKTKLVASYSDDGLHMTPAGYQKVADSIDLELFQK